MDEPHGPAWPMQAAITVIAAVGVAGPWSPAAGQNQVGPQAGSTCSASSGTSVAPVVELYTSEGCNSCPPADRWLSALKADPGVVAMAFHVDYWDRLGWKDRFGSPAYTQRQAQQQVSNGARFSYTPQIVVDGEDRKDWYARPAPASKRDRAPARLALTMAREAGRITATVLPGPGAPARLAAYWTVTEQDHETAVKAGENEGVNLKHDFVVREYKPVTAWAATAGAAVSLSYEPSTSPDRLHPRQVNLVVLDASSGRPVQALRLGC